MHFDFRDTQPPVHRHRVAARCGREVDATMCGIVGILGREPVAGPAGRRAQAPRISRLRFRGRRHAGKRRSSTRRRAEGKLRNLEARLRASRSPAPSASATPAGRPTASRPRATRIRTPPTGSRWCTTASSRISASCATSWKRTAPSSAARPTPKSSRISSPREMKKGRTPAEAVQAALPRLRGAFALAFLFAGEEDLLIGARKGSPLAVGYGDGEMYLGSDAIALAPFTDTISYLEDGDWAVVTRKGVEVHDVKGSKVERAGAQVERLGVPGRQGQPPPLHGEGNPRAARGRRPHAGALSRHGGRAGRAAGRRCRSISASIERLSISACGTAYYAGLVAKYWFERFARLPVEIDVASEFRYREAPFAAGRSRAVRLAVGRDRRHARDAALRQGAEAARRCRSSTCRPRPSRAKATW